MVNAIVRGNGRMGFDRNMLSELEPDRVVTV